MEHTKGPWRLGSMGQIVGSDGNGDTICVMVDDEIIEANARRIVACVNACEGVSNIDLEMDGAKFIEVFRDRSTQNQRIAELEARVKELEANAKTLATANYENQVELQEQLTASRAQVDRLVEAAQNLRKVKGRYHTEQAFNALMEALAAVEKELNNV